MSAPPPPTKTLGQFIDEQIAKLIYSKGNIDGILYNMRPDDPNRGICSWIQSIIYDMLGMCQAIKIDY
jgi:hypothetical protein